MTEPSYEQSEALEGKPIKSLSERETLSYKPECECTSCKLEEALEKPLGFNSHVIKLEMRVNKAEDAGQPLTSNQILIEQAEGATKVTLELLKKIEPNTTDQRGDVQGCIWTLEGWLKNNLHHLKKGFE